MKKLATILTLLLVLTALAPAASAAAAERPSAPPASTATSGGLIVNVIGTTTNAVATITGFTTQNGVLMATGTITGAVTTLVNGVPTVTQVTDAAFTAPVSNLNGTCDILTLDVGAIHLDLLGLVVDTAPIHVAITAQSGPGNLLGNLLCAVAHLLDNPGATVTGLSRLLDQILGAL